MGVVLDRERFFAVVVAVVVAFAIDNGVAVDLSFCFDRGLPVGVLLHSFQPDPLIRSKTT